VKVQSTKVGVARRDLENYKVILAGGYSSTQQTGDGWDINLQAGNWWFDYSEDQTKTPRIVVDYLYPISKKFALIGEIMNQESDRRGVLLMSLDF